MNPFSRVVAFLEEPGAATLGGQDGLRVRLIVQEFTTSTIRHGHRQNSDQPVIPTITAVDNEVALTYEDTALLRNPYSDIRVPDESVTIEQGPVGGLGVALFTHMAKRIEYSYAQARNRIWLVVGTGLLGSGPRHANCAKVRWTPVT
jgi:anti-sigma regulatory factor (Ser/Thr protein kinase)